MSTAPGRGPISPARWREHRSTHFVFWFMPRSRVANSVTALASRLEAVREATVQALDLEDLPGEQVEVYLSEMPNGRRSRREQGDGGDGRGHEAGSGKTLTVYLSDAPGESLELAFMELLLTSSLGMHADGSAMLVDGVLGYVARQTGDSDPDEIDAALARRHSKGDHIGLIGFLQGPPHGARSLYYQVVASFIDFLLTTYGAEPFKRFAQEFDPDAPELASEAAYEKPLDALKQEWLASLGRPRPSAPGQALGVGMEQPPPETLTAQPSGAEPKTATPGIVAFLRSILSYMRPYWKQVALVLLATAVTSALPIVLSLAFGQVIDELGTQNYGRLWIIVIGVVAAFLVYVPATLIQSYLSGRVGANISNDIQYKMFEHLQRLGVDYYSRTRPGDITSRFTNDLALLNTALTQVLPLTVSLVLMFVGSLISLFFLQVFLALAVVLALPLFFILPARFGPKATRTTDQMQQDRAVVTSTVQENVGAQQLIKAYSLQELMLGRFRSQLDGLGHSVTRGSFFGALPGTTARISAILVQVLALAGGTIAVIYGALGLGALTSFQLLLGGVTAPVMAMTSVWQTLLQAAVGMQRIEELLAERPKVLDPPDAQALGPFREGICFENVDFSYTGEQMNLHDVNLTITRGQAVAFVGPSGSGKSTILSLIMRFYDPASGAVIVDGRDLRRVTQESLRSQIGTVFQETFLYNTTVRENITLGKMEATDEEVKAAAKAAEIHDFILTLPRGYDTPVGERGDQLSGGQRQRIAIARAILYDPAILVLDEPTSALDPQSEAAINHTLREQGKGRTVAIVTHRLASVVDVDRVFVLERGRIVEQGSHEELLRARGLYYQLWGQQNGFEDAGRVGTEASRLRAVPFFEGLDEALLPALAERCSREHCEEGQTVFEEGDLGDRMYFIDRGEVEVLATGPGGEQRRVALLRDGDYFGEIALLEDVPRTATVRTRAPTTLLALEREQFLDLLQTLPDLRTAFEREVEARRQANLAALRETV